MKINLRTISQALDLGQKIYREWNRYQSKKNQQQAKNRPTAHQQSAPRSSAPSSSGQERFGNFSAGSPASTQAGTGSSQRQAPPSNPYATGYPAGFGQAGSSSPAAGSWQAGGYPGDYRGRVDFSYSPSLDGEADPGEVVWAWVPFEEDYSQGKDRPVLVVGHAGPYLLGLMLTSKDHNNSRAQDPNYLDIGSGVWDPEGRDSEVKLNRVIQLNPQGIRREGAIMDRSTFDFIAQAFRQA